jgi:Txe/YoeB family toxin of Txe-Axe toxin-antitoxin module
MDDLARRVYEFSDDRFVFKVKTLKIEAETEIEYEKIKIIEKRRVAELGWLRIAFLFIMLPQILTLIWGSLEANLIFQFIQKAMIVLGLGLSLPAFHKNEYCCFLDKDRNYLATILVNNRNRKAFDEAINLIKQKTELISETNLTNPFNNISPVFEIIQYDFPDYFSKSIARFYDDRLIDVEKSLVEEVTTEVKYSELSGKTRIIRAGNAKWDYVWSSWLVFICSLGVIVAVFFPQYLKPKLPYAYLLLGGLILLVPMFFLHYIKNEILVFFNHNDCEVYWARLNSSNREKFNQIIDFLRNKQEVSKTQ